MPVEIRDNELVGALPASLAGRIEPESWRYVINGLNNAKRMAWCTSTLILILCVLLVGPIGVIFGCW